jgi:hypothetical protein
MWMAGVGDLAVFALVLPPVRIKRRYCILPSSLQPTNSTMANLPHCLLFCEKGPIKALTLSG